VARALERADVRFRGGRRVDVHEGSVVAWGRTADVGAADRIVSLPLIRGPRLEGVPQPGVYGLIPVDGYGRVDGLPGGYAIGDATDFPIKQGGLACQQADAAAEHIAARHGAPVVARPFVPELQAVLLTGEEPIVFGAATDKLPGRHLAPYLAAARGAVAG
jgi:sulfide:quinone oxidoreductase